jgi:hypothetical protein
MGDAALGHDNHRDGGGYHNRTVADSNMALDRIGGLSDLELAFLLCLINREHCIISTQPASLDDLVEELKLVSSRTFGLAPLVISCSPTTTLDDLAAGIVHPVLHPPSHAHAHVHRPLDFQASSPTRSPSPMRSRLYSARTTSPPLHHQPDQSSYFPSPGGGSGALTPIPSAALAFGGPGTSGNGNSHPPGTAGTFSPPAGGIANVILARNLDHSPRAVQVQVLELLRTRRIFTRTSVQTAPRPFLFVAVLSSAPVPTAPMERSSQSRSRSRSAAVAVGPGTGAGTGTGTATASTSTHPSPVVSAPASHQTTSMTGLIPHLNDYFFIAHRHDALLDGFANLDEDWARANPEEEQLDHAGDSAETASVLRKGVPQREGDATFSEDVCRHHRLVSPVIRC